MVHEDEVPSPCVSLCKMAPALHVPGGLCAGCQRTIEEIVAWGQATSVERREIWRRITERRTALGLTEKQRLR